MYHTRKERSENHQTQRRTHNKKLSDLSEKQERPLFNVENTVITCGLTATSSAYVLETLALGPKNAVLDRFNPKDILAELDGLLYHCRKNNIPDETITDINVKILTYIKKCRKMRNSKNIMQTNKYLKDHDLLAIPFDKGIGICLMKKSAYHEKLNSMINLPQFKKIERKRKNEKHPTLKEEERIRTVLKALKNNNKIDQELHEELRPKGSQPARLYRLAKVHKENTPLRPVLSMPGSAYHKVAKKVAEWLSVVPECNINSSTKSVSDSLKNFQLNEDEELVSFDVTSLYTNVPVMEAINICTKKLYDMPDDKKPPVDRATFIKLTSIAACDVIMLTHDGH